MSQHELPLTVEALAISKVITIHEQLVEEELILPNSFTVMQTGGVEVIEKMTLPFPRLDPCNLIVKIEYMGVNFIDTYFRKGLYPLDHFPATLGGEAAGIVVGLPTDPDVLNDLNYIRQGFVLGMKVAVTALGMGQTYVSVPWLKAFPTSGVSTRVAAAGISNVGTAIAFFEEAYKVKKGDTVFIHTIAGGLGLVMAQLGKHIGATVIGTTSTQEKADLARGHGADHVILYKEEDTVKRVMEITNGEGVDVVYDGVGKDTFEMDFVILRRKGTLVSVGNASGPVPPFSPIKLMSKNLSLLRPTVGSYVVTPDEVHYYGNKAFELISTGVLKINIFREYSFTTEGGRQAQLDLVGGKTAGKLLIKVAED